MIEHDLRHFRKFLCILGLFVNKSAEEMFVLMFVLMYQF